MATESAVERALRELQRVARLPPSDDVRPVMSGRLPADLQSDGLKSLTLNAVDAAALRDVRRILITDLGFEYMDKRDIDRATWRFVALATMYPSRRGLVRDFVEEHRHEPKPHTCFFAVDLLSVADRVELFGVALLPASQAGPPLTPTPISEAVQTVVAVPCAGTSYKLMADRAQEVAERALRLLRVTIRDTPFLPDSQLRFRLVGTYWFDDGAQGWGRPSGAGIELELDDGLIQRARSKPVSSLPVSATNDVERRAELALRWFERAQLSTDPTLQLLFLFVALEAMLGDKSEGLKARALAMRRAMLGLATTGHIRHPSATYLLYDEARSATVHGEEPPVVAAEELDRFEWDVRISINEFVEYAHEHGLTKRSRVRKALDGHERRDRLIAALRESDPVGWGQYFDQIGVAAPASD